MEKRVFIGLIIFFALILSIHFVSALDCYGQDSNSNSYYDICSCVDLQKMENNLVLNYELRNDIDCLNNNFRPVGYDFGDIFLMYSGHFNGNNHLIKNLNIDYTSPGYGGCGLFGSIYGATIESVGIIDSTIHCKNNYIGGLVGTSEVNCLINNSFFRGKIIAEGIGRTGIGGLVGFLQGTKIINSYSESTIDVGKNGYNVGGLIGWLTDKGIIENSYANSTININTIYPSYVGGLVGSIQKSGISTFSYWDKETSGIITSIIGTGKTTAQMRTMTTFVGWDFTNVWKISEGIDYPRLIWETSQVGSECLIINSKRCLATVSQTCSDYNGDGYYEWGGDVSCSLGCNPATGICNGCTNQCTPSGIKQCSGTVSQTCSDYNSDGCLEWGGNVACSLGCNPATGICNGCTNQCTPSGIKQCSGTVSQTCSDYNGDSCYEWGGNVACSGSTPNCNNGLCVQCSIDSHCTDNNLCNGLETCSALGICQAGTPLVFDDSIDCTHDSCDPIAGVINNPDNSLCNDNNPCTNNICLPPTGCSYPLIPDCTDITSAYWTNMEYNPITNADLNDRVKMVALGQGFSGNSVIYVLKKQEGGNIFDWFFPDSTISAQSSNKGFASWRANATGDYYFIASVQGISEESGILHVSSIENNNPPVTKIENPKIGEIYNITDIIAFNQSSYDVDDFINYSWNFDDGNITKGWSFDYINYNITHKYYSLGQKNILLNVTDERGLRGDDFASILILGPTLNNIYVFANISIPSWNQLVPSRQDLDANGSFAIQVLASPLTIKCLGGNCPLFIGTIPVDSNGQRGQFNNLNFTWKFDDGSIDVNVAGNPRLLGKLFGSSGIHIINLTVILNTGERGSTYVSIFVDPSIGPQGNSCQNGLFWQSGISYITTIPDDKCTMLDGNPDTNCCPAGAFSCRLNTTMPIPQKFQCQLDVAVANYCDSINSYSDYNQANCNFADICGKCRQGCGGGALTNICGDGTSITIPLSGCSCKWEAGVCKQERINQLNLLNGISLYGTCESQVISASDCEDGAMIVTQNSNRIWDPAALTILQNTLPLGTDVLVWLETNCPGLSNLCYSGTREIICGEEAIKLSFFSLWNFVIIIAIIIVVYIVGDLMRINKKNKNYKNQKKSIFNN